MNNVVVYEKTITATAPTILLLLNVSKDLVLIDLDYWRCVYNNTIFNVPITEMPDTIVNSTEIPLIVLEQLIRISYE